MSGYQQDIQDEFCQQTRWCVPKISGLISRGIFEEMATSGLQVAGVEQAAPFTFTESHGQYRLQRSRGDG